MRSRIATFAVALGGCADPNLPDCQADAATFATSPTVDASSATPTFTWDYGDASDMTSVTVTCDGVEMWSLWCADRATCISSPLTYGQDPAGIDTSSDTYIAAQDLTPGATCTLSVYRVCGALENASDNTEGPPDVDFTIP
jgi:hypothetical protein